METLEIKKDAAIEAHGNAKSSGKKMLEDLFGKKTFQIEVTDRIKTFDDVLKETGTHKGHFNNSLIGLSLDESAYRKIKLISEALNEGWEPDWNDHSEYKYYPWFKMDSSSGSGFSYGGCGSWGSTSCCGSRLCFKTRELAKYAGQNFEAIYKEFLTI